MGEHEAEVNLLAADTGKMAGCWGAEGCIMDWPRHSHTGQKLEGLAVPQSHLWVREVSYRAEELVVSIVRMI